MSQESIEAAFHQILYYRKIYPDSIYSRRKLYGICIYVSEHPDLNEYLKNVLNALRELLKDDISSVKSVQIIFFNNKQIPVEKFVFDILDLKASDKEADPYFLKTEEALRTICLKISTMESYLKPLPENSTFRINFVTFESSHIGLSENANFADFPWIVDDVTKDLKNQQLLPLKTIKTECLNLQMYTIEDKLSKINENNEATTSKF
ncbi:mitotic spindle assembly checkpoint protein MAD2B isoform X2 [Leptopilina boulardi]|uniref:mitotic spindle assembly checkpoint protein MAD2B isoform X2 n=1 Tax=Leptopilina boulardi TaxID=63433 RepID=UPI0021F632BF|nr:mitotic spindle assembly checkpoint protein MAD2B isoform X2 [Leptopilina boulardi]